jgi:hypothetical protein
MEYSKNSVTSFEEPLSDSLCTFSLPSSPMKGSLLGSAFVFLIFVPVLEDVVFEEAGFEAEDDVDVLTLGFEAVELMIVKYEMQRWTRSGGECERWD